MRVTSSPTVSIVIPVFRGARTIAPLVESLGKTLADYALEVVLVDDASPDDSALVCERLATRHSWVRFVALAQNVGEHSAVFAGLHHTTGDIVVVMDDDLQHPPEEVCTLVDALGPHDVVYGRYRDKQHGVLRNLGSYLNGRVATWAYGKPPGLYLSSFKAMRRSLVDALCRVQDPIPYLDGHILRLTRRVTEVSVDHLPRRVGRSNYGIVQLIGVFLRQVHSSGVLGDWGVVVRRVLGAPSTAFVVKRTVGCGEPGHERSVS